jgi:hypothetical protein
MLAAVNDATSCLPRWVLFPEAIRTTVENSPLGETRFLSPPAIANRDLNEEQRAAVSHALEAGERFHLPYVVFGPPGVSMCSVCRILRLMHCALRDYVHCVRYMATYIVCWLMNIVCR